MVDERIDDWGDDTGGATHRVVAFLDVLGWEDRTRSPDSVMWKQVSKGSSFIEITADLIEQRRKNVAEQGSTFGSTVRRSHFSDTIVFSCEPDPLEAWTLVDDVRMIAGHLLGVGHYTRGAITVGSVRHDEGAIYGPALVEAYRLERSVASYPRIIVTDEAALLLGNIRQNPWEPNELSPLLEDNDGLTFLRLFWRKPDGTLHGLLRRSVKSIREQVAADIQRTRDKSQMPDPVTALKLRAKYEWMMRHIDRVLSEDAAARGRESK